MKGKVKKFDKEKGYGFIVAEDGKDVFFHYSAIISEGFRTAETGDSVEFEIEQSDKGLKAKNVVRL